MIKKLAIEKLMPDSPLVGTSTRRNCPCCIETLNFASLDTPSSRFSQQKMHSQQISIKNANFRIIYKNYSSGNLLKVVRRKPLSPFSLKNIQKFKLDEYSAKNAKRKNHQKLSITMAHSKKKNNSKKIFNSFYKEKEISNPILQDNKTYSKDDLEKLWKDQEKIMKNMGGLNKLQKVLKRSNLPPLASSVLNLRYKKLVSSF